MFQFNAEMLGSRAVRARAGLAFFGVCLLWLAYDLRPASTEALNEVVALTGWSADAKMALASSLIEDPTPSQRELKAIRTQVGAIVAAEAARAASRDVLVSSSALVEPPAP